MGSLVVAILALGGLVSCAEPGGPTRVSSPVSEPAEPLPPAAAEDRRRLTEAIKSASRISAKSRPSAADFDAATVGWGRQAAHLYILPLNFEEALRRYDAAHPDAPLGGPPLDFHGVGANLLLCVGGVHEIAQETLCE